MTRETPRLTTEKRVPAAAEAHKAQSVAEESPGSSGVVMSMSIRVGVCLALAVNLGGCTTTLTQSAPHPDRPEIASGRLESDRVRSGCPIKLRLSVRDAGADIVRALASWAYEGSATVGNRSMRIVQDGFAAVPLAPSSLTGRQHGEAEVVLTPLQPGQYHYSVQVEDAAGRRSNVLEQAFTVLPQPAGQPVPCHEPAG